MEKTMKHLDLTIAVTNPNNPDHIASAQTVAQWSEQTQTMKTITTEAILNMPYSILAFEGMRGVVVGHVAITKLDDEGQGTLGGLVVARPGEKIATALTAHLLGTVSSALPELVSCHAYANNKGAEFFARLGGVILGPRGEDPFHTGCSTVINLSTAIATRLASQD
jgi:hypothetical protein